MLFYAIPFLVAVIVIVFIHELGHFLVARGCGMRVETFSIGFGREITGWHDRYGTRWKLGWIPLGGYVKFYGDANVASMPKPEEAYAPDNFHGKPVWQRAAVVVAGPVANFILAIAIFACAYGFIGMPVMEPRIDKVVPGSAAERAGILPGDLVIAVDGHAIDSFPGLQEVIVTRAEERLRILIDRSGTRLTLEAVPAVHEQPDGFGGTLRLGRLGVEHNPQGDIVYERLGPVAAVEKGVERTWFIVSTTFQYLGKMITGHQSTDQLGGPIAMAKVAGDAASVGIFPFLSVIAFLSVSIGLINLFPIPMLDGGHLVYYGIEALRGKPLGRNAQEWGFRVGFSLIILLMAVGTGNDIVRLIAMAIGG
ncbi:MAG: RIP metalloprotease RseP [Aestuariivirga sp.]